MTTVEYEEKDNVARIFLNRPERLNAVVPQLVEDLCQALDRANEDRVAAVILAGRGRAFCAGHDLRFEEPPVPDSEKRRRLERMQDVTRKIRQAGHPVIAAVHGYALGAGCEFALTCDIVVAGIGAQFGFPEVGVGLSVTGGFTRTLPLTVGLVRAKELVLLGQYIGAARAQALGLVNFVVSDSDVESHAMQVAEVLRARPRLALSLAKTAIDSGPEGPIEAAFQLEITHAMACLASHEAEAARTDFQARRK